MLDLLDTNFKALSHPEFIMTLFNISDRLSAHPDFKEEDWPRFVPTPKKLKEQAVDYQESVHAAVNGDRQKIAERNAKRAAAELSASLIAQYAIMLSISENKPALLDNTGYNHKNRSYTKSSSNAVIGAPREVTVRDGAVSGTVVLRCKKVAGAADYEVQVSENPGDEESWKTAGHFVHCRNMEVRGLEPAKNCSFRIRCNGAAGQGPYSEIVTLIIR